jgi:hypothetical protein
VPPGGKIRKRKVGRARLGARREKVVAKVGPPKRSDAGRDAWCVIGGGSMSVHYVDDEASLIRTTTPGHSIRGVGPGDRGAALEKAGFEDAGFRRGRTRVHELRGRRRQLFAGVRGGLVRWIEVARFIR